MPAKSYVVNHPKPFTTTRRPDREFPKEPSNNLFKYPDLLGASSYQESKTREHQPFLVRDMNLPQSNHNTPYKDLVTKGVGASKHIHNIHTMHGKIKSKGWVPCKAWLRKHRRQIICAILNVGLVILAILWYQHVKYTQEMARRRSRWWSSWFRY